MSAISPQGFMVTQKDIARRLGVSPSLVSHVLGGRGRQINAAPRTIARIEREAARREYQPSAAALVLRGRAARMIGVVVKDFDDPYLGHLVGELHRLAREAGYALLVTGCEGGPAFVPVLEPLRRYPLEGILVAGSDVGGGWFGAFSRQGVRGVQLGSGRRIAGMWRLTVDEAGAMAAVITHLLGLGHRRIAFAGCNHGAHARRQAAVEAALRRAGHRLVDVAGWRADDRAALERALVTRTGILGRRVTAVVCADDEVAQGVMYAAQVQGLQVPRELSVTGMDDIPSARLMTPPLTTLHQPLESIIRSAFACLREATDEATGPDATVYRSELIVRGSTASPRPSGASPRSADAAGGKVAEAAERNM